MPEYKVDIFAALNALSTKKDNFWLSLSDDQRKSIVPFLLARWLSGTSNVQQVMLLNEIANPYMFSLYSHKELAWKLLMCCTSGRTQKYIWNKLPPKVNGTHPICSKLFLAVYGYSSKQTNDALKCLTGDDILDIAIDQGMQPEEITKLKKELKDMNLEITSQTKTRKKATSSDDLLSF